MVRYLESSVNVKAVTFTPTIKGVIFIGLPEMPRQNISMRKVDEHFSDEEFIAYVLDDAPEKLEEELDAHLDVCELCLHKVEEYYDTRNSLESEEMQTRLDAFQKKLKHCIFLISKQK